MRYELSDVKAASAASRKWMRRHASQKSIESIGTMVPPSTLCSIIEYFLSEDAYKKQPQDSDPSVKEWLSSISQNEVETIFDSFDTLLEDHDDAVSSEDIMQMCESIEDV